MNLALLPIGTDVVVREYRGIPRNDYGVIHSYKDVRGETLVVVRRDDGSFRSFYVSAANIEEEKLCLP